MWRSVFMANCRGGGRQTKEQLHYTPLVGVDLCCHTVCHCLCGQTARLAPSLLAEYYNTANASSDPWKLPSIEMNHTDGRFVIRQDWPVHRACTAYLEVWIWYRLKKNIKKNKIKSDLSFAIQAHDTESGAGWARRLEKQTENDSSFNKSECHQILALLPT